MEKYFGQQNLDLQIYESVMNFAGEMQTYDVTV